MAIPQAALARRLGIADPRGPEGMFSRGANVYRGGFPNAHMGGGNPNLGRPRRPAVPTGQPSMGPVETGMATPPPTMTAMVGSLPPGGGNQDGMINDAVMQLLRNRLGRQQGVSGG